MLEQSLQHFTVTDKNRFKTVTIHHFPDGMEVFIDENRVCFEDGFLFDTDFDAPNASTKRGEGDRDKSIAASARRAKTAVRRRCKAMQADALLTLTYRENMQDEKRAQRDFQAFRRRLEALGAFPYVATLERQERGAIHLHVAVQHFPALLKNEHGTKVKSYNVIRSIWRRVVGADNGNIDLTRPRGSNSAHRIASYIAKYVSKAVGEGHFNKKSYWSSKAISVPKGERVFYPIDTSTFDLVAMVAKEFIRRGYNDIAQYSDRLNEFHWFAASRGAS